METYEKDLRMAEKIAQMVSQHGGNVYYVGGYVRDKLLQRENKDVDIEVHGITPERLEEVLDSLGTRITMGKSFGVYGLKGYSLDIAMPRKATRRGGNFAEDVEPFVGTYHAAQRRDLTVNALMQDVLSGDIVDHFGGREDLKRGILRHVNESTFAEDGLRVLRCARFAAQLNFSIAPETICVCRNLDLKEIAFERIGEEVKKALLTSDKPSVFFERLKEMDQLSMWFPELEALIGIPQNPVFHAEGDAYTHTMMVLDQAAKLKNRLQHPFAFMLAALVHDFGKAVCTETVNGAIHSYAHEVKGLSLVKAFLERITTERKLMDMVLNAAEHHMKPIVKIRARSSLKSMNKMFDEAYDPEALLCLALADDRGRISAEDPADHEAALYEALRRYNECMEQPYVMGRDLVAAGLQPGAEFAEVLAYAHKLRLACVPKENALKQTLAYARQLKKKTSG